MGKTYKELHQEYDNIQGKLLQGHGHIVDLFLTGLTVKDPLQDGKEITFNTSEQGEDYLNKLNKHPEYPLHECGRLGNQHNHMKLFLYSKGFTADDVTELMVNPESERSKELGEQIQGFRQEYFDMILNKDVEKIGKMYADAFKNLEKEDMSWLKQSDTPEKIIENWPKFDAFSGSQSFYLQTNNLGTGMTPVDRQVMEQIKTQTEKTGIDLQKMVDGLQYVDLTQQYLMKAFKPDKRNSLTGHIVMAQHAQANGALPEDVTLSGLGMEYGISREQQFMTNAGVFTRMDMDNIDNTDFTRNLDAWIQGEEGALPPLQLIETTNDDLMSFRMEWQQRTDEDGLPAYEEKPRLWKSQMEENFREGTLMDAGSVNHCVSLAKDGEYDAIAGRKGEGERMLDVMNGNYAGYGSLTDLSKAAVSGRMVMEHPDLFMNSVPQMKKAAMRLGMNLENPAYTDAMEGVSRLMGPQSTAKIDQLKESFAVDKLENGLRTASREEKKNLAKSLFLMQLGDVEPDGIANGRNKKAEMLNTLAGGGTVHFALPKMTREESASLKGSFPEGKQQVADGIRQNVSYGKDNTLSVKMEGSMGHAHALGGMEADLRGITPKNLNTMLTALDEKMSSMSDNEMDELIGKLRGESMDKSKAADLVRSLGFNADGTEKANRPHLDLAAKEISHEPVLGQNDLFAIERSYTMALDGERKYNAPRTQDTARFELTLLNDPVPEHKEFFSKYLEHYKEQARQMQMYADAAERMHRVKMDNENSAEPLDNVRTFAQNKEKELAEKYRAAKESVRKMEEGISDYSILHNSQEKPEDKKTSKTWVLNYIDNKELAKEVAENAGKKGPTKDEMDAGLAGNFTAVDMEASTFREQQNLNNSKWTLLGVKYSNSDKYQDILDSMDKLKQMRGMDATKENIQAYRKEYEHLRDLCEDYIVSRKNPWTQDGKDRKKMVTDVWEGMSNVNSQTFDSAEASVKEGQKIGDMNIHVGYRRKISLQELQARQPERDVRLKADREARKEAWRRQREQEKANQRSARQREQVSYGSRP